MTQSKWCDHKNFIANIATTKPFLKEFDCPWCGAKRPEEQKSLREELKDVLNTTEYPNRSAVAINFFIEKLPERRTYTFTNANLIHDYDAGWNACLDEIKSMWGKK